MPFPDKQEHIFCKNGGSADEVKSSPFVERLLKKGFKVFFLTEAMDEYVTEMSRLWQESRSQGSLPIF